MTTALVVGPIEAHADTPPPPDVLLLGAALPAQVTLLPAYVSTVHYAGESDPMPRAWLSANLVCATLAAATGIFLLTQVAETRREERWMVATGAGASFTGAAAVVIASAIQTARDRPADSGRAPVLLPAVGRTQGDPRRRGVPFAGATLLGRF